MRANVSTRLRAVKLASLPEPIRADTGTAIGVPKDKRNPVQAYLALKLGPLLAVSPDEVNRNLSAAQRMTVTTAESEIARLNSTRQSYETIRVAWETGPPAPTYLYRRGDYTTPGPEVKPGVPLILDPANRPTSIPTAGPGQKPASRGRRLACARWLPRTDPPVTARGLVNRMWMRYLGTGLVSTPANFGLSGTEPTHPKLLDWLARALVAQQP